jgi:hypothetical protein
MVEPSLATNVISMRLDGLSWERSMFGRMYAVGFAAIFGLGFGLTADESLSRPAGFGGRVFSISSGLHHFMLRPMSPPSVPPSSNRREFAARVPPRPFGFGFPVSLFGDFPVPFSFGFPVTRFEFGPPESVPSNCFSFYCTYYDPSHSTYVDPYRRPPYRDPGTVTGPISGGVNPGIGYRRGCDTETVTIPLGDDKESSLKIVRC